MANKNLKILFCKFFILILSSLAHSEDKVSTTVGVLSEDGDTNIVMPHGSVEKDIIKDGASIFATYTMDALSSASIDVVSSATKKIKDTRQEVSGGTKINIKNTNINASYLNGTENDYDANAVNLGVSQLLFEKNTEIALGYTRGWDTVGIKGGGFSEDLIYDTVSLAYTQVISPNAIGQINYYGTSLNGYLSIPYKYVDVGSSTVLEKLPDSRMRNSFTLLFKEYLPWKIALHEDYRYYFDDWGINSHTFNIKAVYEVIKNMEVSLRYRFYTQSDAVFYKEEYTSLMKYVTDDKEYSELNSNMIGSKLAYTFEKLSVLRNLELSLSGYYYIINYQNYSNLDNLDGILLVSGVSFNF